MGHTPDSLSNLLARGYKVRADEWTMATGCVKPARYLVHKCMHAVCTHRWESHVQPPPPPPRATLKCGALVSDWQRQLSLSDCRAHREGPRGLIDHSKFLLFVAGGSRFRDKFRFFVDDVRSTLTEVWSRSLTGKLSVHGITTTAKAILLEYVGRQMEMLCEEIQVSLIYRDRLK